MIPWAEDIRQSGTLTIHMDGLAGNWAHIFREALRDFNSLSAANKLGVKLTASKRPPEAGNGANVSVQTADGAISATYGDSTRAGEFDGKRLHGLTLLFFERQGAGESVYLPAQAAEDKYSRRAAAGRRRCNEGDRGPRTASRVRPGKLGPLQRRPLSGHASGGCRR